MGCFDSNCCLTGLPLQHGDDIRMALLVPNNPNQNACYVGDEYQFWTPPVRSTYNDYGNLEWMHIPSAECDVLEFLLRISLPALEDHEQYSRNFFDGKEKFDIPLTDVWDMCLHGGIELDSGRQWRKDVAAWEAAGKPEATRPPFWNLGSYLTCTEPMVMRPWACHEWAWQALCDLHKPSPKLLAEVDMFCKTAKMLYDEVLLEFSQEDAYGEVLKRRHEPTWVMGSQGGFSATMFHLLQYIDSKGEKIGKAFHDEYVAILPEFKRMMVDTATICNNIFLIRQCLRPMITIGPQHDEHDVLPAWNQLIATKAKLKYDTRRWELGYDDDEEDFSI